MRAIITSAKMEGESMTRKKVVAQMPRVIFVAVLLIGVAVGKGWAENLLQPKTLQGLRGVYVKIVMTAHAQTVLTDEQVRADVEGRLRQEGVSVLSRQQWEAEPGRPHLLVGVSIMRNKLQGNPSKTYLGPNNVAYSLSLDLTQDCILSRDNTVTAPAVTWNDSNFGTANSPDFVRQILRNSTSTFARAYFANQSQKER